MKQCPNCHAAANDDATFCTNCGAPFLAAGQQAGTGYQNPGMNYGAPNQQAYAPDPFDHTAEFDPKDISDNKVISMLVYLLGTVGIIIALLAANTSKYAAFHVRQALKFVVIEALTGICAALLFWTVIAPVVAGVFLLILFVVKVICFFQICSGKAKEPAIIRGFSFLK